MSQAPHLPVLKEEVIGHLRPGPGKRILDGTYGYGGHAAACLDAGAEVLGLDLDEEATAACLQARARRPRLQCRRESFRCLAAALAEVGWGGADGILLDLGVSSPQLDEPARGFTYRAEADLDLRFDRSRGETAAALVARLPEPELARLLHEYGEERGARRIARQIAQRRRQRPLRTTTDLRDAVAAALPAGARLEASLSRVFQALRIAVNDELGALAAALAAAPERLNAGGRLVVISYHSLEDRLVKRSLDLESRDCICPPRLPVCRCGHRRRLRVLTRRPLRPGSAELAANPRARSARLRAAERLSQEETR